MGLGTPLPQGVGPHIRPGGRVGQNALIGALARGQSAVFGSTRAEGALKSDQPFTSRNLREEDAPLTRAWRPCDYGCKWKVADVEV